MQHLLGVDVFPLSFIFSIYSGQFIFFAAKAEVSFSPCSSPFSPDQNPRCRTDIFSHFLFKHKEISRLFEIIQLIKCSSPVVSQRQHFCLLLWSRTSDSVKGREILFRDRASTSLQQTESRNPLGSRKKNLNFCLSDSKTQPSAQLSAHSIHLGRDGVKWSCNSSCLYFDVLRQPQARVRQGKHG